MTTADMIKQLCEQMNISVAELARRIGQTPQNFNKKLKRETVTLDELKAIADVLDIKFEQAFTLPDGNEIKTGNEYIRRFRDMNDNFYKQLMEQSPVGYAYHKIICNETGTPCDYEFVEVNKVFEELMGMKGTDIIGKPITEVLPEIKKSEFDWIAFYGEIALKGEKKEFEQYSEPLKRWYWVSALSPEKGYFITTFNDITERNKVEDELNRFKTISDNAVFGNSIADLDGKLVYVNKFFAEIHGYTPDELLGKPVSIFHTTEQLEKVDRTIAHMLEMGHFEQQEIWHVHRNGRVFPMLMSGVVIKDEKNRPQYIATSAIDITKSKHAEKRVRESEERFQKMLSMVPDMISIHDLDMNIIYSNWNGFAAVQEEKRILNTKCHKTYRNMDEICPDCQAKTVLQTKTAFQAEKKRPDGKWEDLRVMPFFGDDDNIQFFLEWVRDITEIKKFEENLLKSAVELEQHQKDLEIRLLQSVNAISKIGELRDAYTAGHQIRVEALACAIGRDMGLVAEQIYKLSFGALIHDIGKFFIPSEILNKPGKISALEYQILQTHAEESYNVVKEIDFPEEIHTMIYQHHERLDGSGYPQGLSGDEIILQSRILAVADVVEAMNSHRPYRPALGIDAALEEIQLHRGTKYDVEVVDICVRLFKEDGYAF